ncbi:NADH-quinone oxidoreductase subunit J [Devosia rhodophyticola]|uniref:NADH-quinone oxidoreductase subunit J n=1 Tax=Devosia rhodophyticola TaxID=3026423 RepID=A0ABY7Z319_9HYPH|nr:NADH-quinone oxidoreductase subunit J [Devosia rhodophyticola]WDR07600.1 NADH-quinone oxidoreductase subunit J [Devosia rhodophyticola]
MCSPTHLIAEREDDEPSAIFFYVFSTIAVISALMVISSRNPVHSVLFLILVFLNASGLFLLAGAEFLALLLVVVYVGAVMVLFLFVVMMLDVDFGSMRQGILQYMPIGVVIGIIFLLELLLVAGSFVIAPQLSGVATVPIDMGVQNTKALGLVIYTRYAFLFEGAGAVLLVAMIGAIVLTLRHKVNVKRQDPAVQSARRPADAMKIVKVKSGQGL